MDSLRDEVELIFEAEDKTGVIFGRKGLSVGVFEVGDFEVKIFAVGVFMVWVFAVGDGSLGIQRSDSWRQGIPQAEGAFNDGAAFTHG